MTQARSDCWLLEMGQRRLRHITGRLKKEILNQSVGVDVGDELEVERDPVVRRALGILTSGQ